MNIRRDILIFGSKLFFISTYDHIIHAWFLHLKFFSIVMILDKHYLFKIYKKI